MDLGALHTPETTHVGGMMYGWVGKDLVAKVSARRQEETARSVVLRPSGGKRVQGSRNQGPGLQKHPWAFLLMCGELASAKHGALFFPFMLHY